VAAALEKPVQKREKSGTSAFAEFPDPIRFLR
jgi:hypothetical protein